MSEAREWSKLGRKMVESLLPSVVVIGVLLLFANDRTDGDELWKGFLSGQGGYWLRSFLDRKKTFTED